MKGESGCYDILSGLEVESKYFAVWLCRLPKPAQVWTGGRVTVG